MFFTMRAWPVARSIFDAPLGREANERGSERAEANEGSERADNKLDNMFCEKSEHGASRQVQVKETN